MRIFTAAIALFSDRGVGQREKLPEDPSNDEVETKSTILVIDDDPLLLHTVQSLLGKRGFNVLTTPSAPKAVCRRRWRSELVADRFGLASAWS